MFIYGFVFLLERSILFYQKRNKLEAVEESKVLIACPSHSSVYRSVPFLSVWFHCTVAANRICVGGFSGKFIVVPLC